MEANASHQMAIDLLMCHLGISEEEAAAQLGLEDRAQLQQQQIAEVQAAFMGLEENH
jgi:hypothetical protein